MGTAEAGGKTRKDDEMTIAKDDHTDEDFDGFIERLCDSTVDDVIYHQSLIKCNSCLASVEADRAALSQTILIRFRRELANSWLSATAIEENDQHYKEAMDAQRQKIRRLDEALHQYFSAMTQIGRSLGRVISLIDPADWTRPLVEEPDECVEAAQRVQAWFETFGQGFPRWTLESPAEPGWYFWTESASKLEATKPVAVRRVVDMLNESALEGRSFGSNEWRSMTTFSNGRWFGPIRPSDFPVPPPIEP